MFQWSGFQGCLQEVEWVFETDNLVMLKSFLLHQQRQVSKVFQKSFKIISRKIYGCFESPLRVVQGSFKISKRSSQGVSKVLIHIPGLLSDQDGIFPF